MSDGTFKLGYERDAYDTIDTYREKAYVYLYNVETGEILKEWKNQTIMSEDEPTQFSLNDPEPKVTLDMDTTYAIAAIDTYGLGGTTYTTKLFEKIFTTDSTGVQVQLMDRSTDSFTVNVAATGESTDPDKADYTKIKKVTVTVKNKNGETVRTEEYTDNFGSLLIGKGTPTGTANNSLESNSWYSMEFSVECTVAGADRTIRKTLDWTTLKQAPSFGGLSLRSENGYLIAKVLGNYDAGASEYGTASDPDNTLESITYRIYTAWHLVQEDKVPVTYMTETSTADAYFRVDGSLLSNEAVYYVLAEYTWNDGARSITVPVMESYPSGKTSANDNRITTDSLKGRAFAETQALTGSGVSMSFSGSGTQLFNLTGNQDSSEGTTYESIKGSVSVNLNGLKISVNDTRRLTLEVTDNLTYKKRIRFSSCDGKQGDIEGSFALPIDLDGMVAGNTYACTLYGYVYNQSTDEYTSRSIATLTIRTDTEKNITMGMRQAENGGTGVDFWLGAEEATSAANLTNYYDQKNSTYVLENGTTEGESDYFANTDASYRNLSSIVFELYNGTNPIAKNLIGTCTVYGTDSNDDRASFMPGYSLLYRKYYGKAAFSSGDNSVGVGESFTHQFNYDVTNTGLSGPVTETALSGMGDGNFTIVAKVCYDYTWDRYNYTGNDDLYDYITYDGNLEMEDYVNALTVNGGSGATVNILYQNRPVAPGNVVYDNGYALTVDTLENENMGAYSGKTATDNYDPALLAGTAIGVDIGTRYEDSNKLARTLTFYGTTYDLAESEKTWPSDQTLTQVKDSKYQVDDEGTEADVFGFKFTLPMTQDGSPDGVDDKDKRRSSVPHIWLFTYDDANTTFADYLKKSGFDEAPTDDRGYSYRKYDEKNDVWLVYSSFLKRGKTYVFAYEADLDFTIGDNQGSFSYPGDYYKNGWVTGKKYAKNTTLRSVYTPLLRQTPQVDLELLSSEAASDVSGSIGSDEVWNIYLDDPDNAIMSDSLLGYSKEYEDAGAIYGISGNEITDDQTGYSTSYKQYIGLDFARASGEHYKLQYRINDTEDLTVRGKVTALLSDDGTSDISDEETRKQVVSDLITAMKQVTVTTDGSGNVESAGTQITVSNLNPDGIYYSWKAIYRLLDDYQTKSQQGKIPLITHYFTGHETWEAGASTNDNSHPNNSSFTLTTASKAASGGSYTVSTVLDTDTNDIMTVSIPRSEGTQWNVYYADMLKIAGVKITAVKKDKDGKTTQIWAKDDEGKPTETPSAVWATVSDLGSGEYGFSFRISSLDKSASGGEAQFTKDDTLIFTYTFYYDNGDRNTADEIAKNTDDSDLWYAMKSVNGYTGSLALYQRVPATSSKDRSSDEQRRSQNASGSLYHIAATENEAAGIKAPSVTRTVVTGNDGQKYISSIIQRYTLTEAPIDPDDLKEPLLRTESMRYNSGINGYWNNNVAEFIRLGTVEATASITVQQIAPTLAEGYKITPSITQAKMDLNIESYNLMNYPDTEILHLYYAVYKETEEIDEDSGENVKKLTLAGVMIGESDQTDADGKVKGSRQVVFDKLEKNQTYRLYVYYKDNRNNQASTDAAIFQNALESGEDIATLAGTFVTGEKAEKLAERFTEKTNGVLDPTSNYSVNGIQKIMGIKEVVAKKADSETGEGAVYDYYEKFKTSTGIVINSLKVDSWGLWGRYLQSGVTTPEGENGETSGKTLQVTATTGSVQNDHTRMFFVLERCPMDEKMVEENWRTVFYDGGTTGVEKTDPEYAPAYPTDKDTDAEGNSSNPEYRTLDTAVSESGMTKTDFRSYGNDYTYTALSDLNANGESTGTYKATMSFTAYPGYAVAPGYYYRVRAMLFQFDENWEHPSLISLESLTSEKQYKSSSATWAEYTYNDADKLVKVTNVERSESTIKATVRATNKGFSLDDRYYVRLWKHEGNKWVVVEEDKYYGNYSSTSTVTWNKMALQVGSLYTLSFQDLEPDTEYQLRFYGLMDTNYDNHLNIQSEDGTPLAAEDSAEIYGNLTNYYNDQTNTVLQNNLKTLYKNYLNIDNYKQADQLKIEGREAQAEKVLLNTSATITTFKKGQTATIGEKYQVSKISANTLQIFFQNASGLGVVDRIEYSIKYEGGDTVSGSIKKQPGKSSVMDGGALTAGNVSLTITNSSLALNNKGTYIVQLLLLDEDDNVIEKPATFDFDVD